MEQNVDIIVASMPVLWQLFTIFRKQRNPHYSHSSEQPFRGGDRLIRSPLHPSIEDTESDNVTSSGSPISNFESRGGMNSEVDSENKSGPTFSFASRLGRWSLTAEKEQGDENSRNTKASSRQWDEKRDRVLTLGNPAMLGYSSEIEGGSPKLRS